MNHWYAECVPCHWQEAHETEDSAISAAEEHVLRVHPELLRMASDARAREQTSKVIGHVQLRAENAVAASVPAFPVEAVVTDPALPSAEDLDITAAEHKE